MVTVPAMDEYRRFEMPCFQPGIQFLAGFLIGVVFAVQGFVGKYPYRFAAV